jgi:hypothetical protein
MTDGLAYLAAGVGGGLLIAWLIRRGNRKPVVVVPQMLVERVRTVGHLVGLEVQVKDIATWEDKSWLKYISTSRRKTAIIYTFEIQYFTNLSASHVEVAQRPDGGFDLRLPPVQRRVSLLDQHVYHEQEGEVLFLLPVGISEQERNDIWKDARRQAEQLLEKKDAEYIARAQESIRAIVAGLLRSFEVDVAIAFAAPAPLAQSEMVDASQKAVVKA